MDSHQGYTALHIAASHGHLETTRVLLKYGASLTCGCEGSYQRPNSQIQMLMTRAHVTALHIAAARRNIPMCRAMLQSHASLSGHKILLYNKIDRILKQLCLSSCSTRDSPQPSSLSLRLLLPALKPIGHNILRDCHILFSDLDTCWVKGPGTRTWDSFSVLRWRCPCRLR